MSRTIAFAAVCPSCKREQPQTTFTVGKIVRLLDGGFPIEAYCEACKQFWPIDLQKRVELAEAVAAASGGSIRADRRMCALDEPASAQATAEPEGSSLYR